MDSTINTSQTEMSRIWTQQVGRELMQSVTF